FAGACPECILPVSRGASTLSGYRAEARISTEQNPHTTTGTSPPGGDLRALTAAAVRPGGSGSSACLDRGRERHALFHGDRRGGSGQGRQVGVAQAAACTCSARDPSLHVSLFGGCHTTARSSVAETLAAKLPSPVYDALK